MLKLDRRPSQSIFVDGPCEIKVLKTSSGRVSLGIIGEAAVRRGELEPIVPGDEEIADLGRRKGVLGEEHEHSADMEMIDHA